MDKTDVNKRVHFSKETIAEDKTHKPDLFNTYDLNHALYKNKFKEASISVMNRNKKSAPIYESQEIAPNIVIKVLKTAEVKVKPNYKSNKENELKIFMEKEKKAEKRKLKIIEDKENIKKSLERKGSNKDFFKFTKIKNYSYNKSLSLNKTETDSNKVKDKNSALSQLKSIQETYASERERTTSRRRLANENRLSKMSKLSKISNNSMNKSGRSKNENKSSKLTKSNGSTANINKNDDINTINNKNKNLNSFRSENNFNSNKSNLPMNSTFDKIISQNNSKRSSNKEKKSEDSLIDTNTDANMQNNNKYLNADYNKTDNHNKSFVQQKSILKNKNKDISSKSIKKLNIINNDTLENNSHIIKNNGDSNSIDKRKINYYKSSSLNTNNIESINLSNYFGKDTSDSNYLMNIKHENPNINVSINNRSQSVIVGFDRQKSIASNNQSVHSFLDEINTFNDTINNKKVKNSIYNNQESSFKRMQNYRDSLFGINHPIVKTNNIKPKVGSISHQVKEKKNKSEEYLNYLKKLIYRSNESVNMKHLKAPSLAFKEKMNLFVKKLKDLPMKTKQKIQIMRFLNDVDLDNIKLILIDVERQGNIFKRSKTKMSKTNGTKTQTFRTKNNTNSRISLRSIKTTSMNNTNYIKKNKQKENNKLSQSKSTDNEIMLVKNDNDDLNSKINRNGEIVSLVKESSYLVDVKNENRKLSEYQISINNNIEKISISKIGETAENNISKEGQDCIHINQQNLSIVNNASINRKGSSLLLSNSHNTNNNVSTAINSTKQLKKDVPNISNSNIIINSSVETSNLNNITNNNEISNINKNFNSLNTTIPLQKYKKVSIQKDSSKSKLSPNRKQSNNITSKRDSKKLFVNLAADITAKDIIEEDANSKSNVHSEDDDSEDRISTDSLRKVYHPSQVKDVIKIKNYFTSSKYYKTEDHFYEEVNKAENKTPIYKKNPAVQQLLVLLDDLKYETRGKQDEYLEKMREYLSNARNEYKEFTRIRRSEIMSSVTGIIDRKNLDHDSQFSSQNIQFNFNNAKRISAIPISSKKSIFKRKKQLMESSKTNTLLNTSYESTFYRNDTNNLNKLNSIDNTDTNKKFNAQKTFSHKSIIKIDKEKTNNDITNKNLIQRKSTNKSTKSSNKNNDITNNMILIKKPSFKIENLTNQENNNIKSSKIKLPSLNYSSVFETEIKTKNPSSNMNNLEMSIKDTQNSNSTLNIINKNTKNINNNNASSQEIQDLKDLKKSVKFLNNQKSKENASNTNNMTKNLNNIVSNYRSIFYLEKERALKKIKHDLNKEKRKYEDLNYREKFVSYFDHILAIKPQKKKDEKLKELYKEFEEVKIKLKNVKDDKLYNDKIDLDQYQKVLLDEGIKTISKNEREKIFNIFKDINYYSKNGLKPIKAKNRWESLADSIKNCVPSYLTRKFENYGKEIFVKKNIEEEYDNNELDTKNKTNKKDIKDIKENKIKDNGNDKNKEKSKNSNDDEANQKRVNNKGRSNSVIIVKSKMENLL